MEDVLIVVYAAAETIGHRLNPPPLYNGTEMEGCVLFNMLFHQFLPSATSYALINASAGLEPAAPLILNPHLHHP